VGTAHPTDAATHNLHNLHSSDASANGASAAEPCRCALPPAVEKKSKAMHLGESDEPKWPDKGKRRQPKTEATASRGH